MEELTIPFLGEQRAQRQYLFEELRASGARLAMGSDWPVTTADPLAEIEVAVRRVSPDYRNGKAFLPAQSLSLNTALRAFTAGSAYVNHDEDGGRLRVGARADLAVLDHDLFGADAVLPADASVTMTVAAGRVEHRSST